METASSSETFRHTPLPSLDSIRLISVQTAPSATDPIICGISASAIEASEHYTALSYSWATENGDDTPHHDIVINGMTKRIGTNLFDALTQIRRQDFPMLMWIDALCINQQDIPERNAQVKNMAMIYAHAHEVVAWVGHGLPDVDEALYRFLDCTSHLKLNEQHRSENHAWTAKARDTAAAKYGRSLDTSNTEGERPFCDILRKQEAGKSIAKLTREEAEGLACTIYSFLNRRYFRRRWVVQEWLHSHGNAKLCWGTYQLPWRSLLTSLLDACNRLFDNFWDVMRGEYTILSSSLGDKGKHMLQVWWGGSLLDMLAHCDGFDCSDDRDRIYSLVVLDNSKDRFEIVPDYGRSTRNVYIEFSQQLIQKGYQDWLFSNRQIPDNPRGEDLNLPSWVFDLRYHLDGPPERLLNKDTSIPFSLGQDNVLTYCPYYFGTVLEVSHAPRHHSFTILQAEVPVTSTDDFPLVDVSTFQTLKTALERAQTRAVADLESRPEHLIPSDFHQSVERLGPLTLYRLYSESPIFRGIEPGDLICGSLPDLRDHDTTVHILKKKENTEDDVYWLYRAWIVHDDMESDRFLSDEVQATSKIKVRLA